LRGFGPGIENIGKRRSAERVTLKHQSRHQFLWMDQLVYLVDHYESQRSQYPTFAAFMPATRQFCASLAPRMKDLSRSFEVRT